jgi:hypothetical protein
VASLQQWASVTFSSELGLLVVGLLLVGFVIVAPGGIVGLARKYLPGPAPAASIGAKPDRARKSEPMDAS